jgi:ParB family chromosome partitioning protein
MNMNPQSKGDPMMKIKIADIIIPDGRREIDFDKVVALAESIKIIGGLIHPITIGKDRTLIAGAHRIEAYKKLGFDEIECTEFDGEDLEAELVEIDENLMRNELDDITIGEMVLRRDEILEELGMRAKQGNNRFTDRGAGDAPLQTTASIAKEVGMSERTLQENKQLAKNLIPEAKAARREKRITKDAALAMTSLTPEQQRDTLKKCEKEGSGRLGKDGKVRPTKYEKRKKTVAKEQPLVEDGYSKEHLPPDHSGAFMRIPLPFSSTYAYYAILLQFREESEEFRNRIIQEVKDLADIIDNLND